MSGDIGNRLRLLLFGIAPCSNECTGVPALMQSGTADKEKSSNGTQLICGEAPADSGTALFPLFSACMSFAVSGVRVSSFGVTGAS
jgi:hypothetical protein